MVTRGRVRYPLPPDTILRAAMLPPTPRVAVTCAVTGNCRVSTANVTVGANVQYVLVEPGKKTAVMMLPVSVTQGPPRVPHLQR